MSLRDHQGSFGVAVSCIDGRIHTPVIEWVRERFGVEHVDLLTHPGPDQALCCAADVDVEHLRASLGISAGAHHPQVLVVAGHDDCAANPVPEAEHRDQLGRALRRARRWAPENLPVVAVWVDADRRVHEVDASPAAAGSGSW